MDFPSNVTSIKNAIYVFQYICVIFESETEDINIRNTRRLKINVSLKDELASRLSFKTLLIVMNY